MRENIVRKVLQSRSWLSVSVHAYMCVLYSHVVWVCLCVSMPVLDLVRKSGEQELLSTEMDTNRNVGWRSGDRGS